MSGTLADPAAFVNRFSQPAASPGASSHE